MAAALVIVCGLSFGTLRWRSDHTVDSTVTLDVNPSISLDVNAKERVLAVTPSTRTPPSSWGTWTSPAPTSPWR